MLVKEEPTVRSAVGFLHYYIYVLFAAVGSAFFEKSALPVLLCRFLA